MLCVKHLILFFSFSSTFVRLEFIIFILYIYNIIFLSCKSKYVSLKKKRFYKAFEWISASAENQEKKKAQHSAIFNFKI